MKLQTNAKDLTGQRFGRLVVIKPTERRTSGSIVWLCECDCGNKVEVISSSLTTGHTKSCGCLHKEVVAKRNIESDLRVEGTNISYLTQKLNRRNTSGHKGVCWHKKTNKWRASIGFKGERYDIGYFENIQDAIKARKQAEEELFEPMLEKYKGLKND